MAFARVQTTNRELNQIQSNIATALQPILNHPLLQGQFIEDVDLVLGSNTIQHNLGRPLYGWIVYRRNERPQLYDDQANNPTPDKTLILIATLGSIRVSLYIF